MKRKQLPTRCAQVALGFERARADLQDLALDYVKAPELLPRFQAQAEAEGWLAPAAAGE